MDFKKLQNYTFITLLILASIVFLWLVRPYFYPLFWAAVIAIIFHPVYRYIHQRLHQPSVAAFLTVLLFIIVILIPILAVVWLVLQEGINFYQSYGQSHDLQWLRNTIQQSLHWQPLQSWLNAFDLEERVSKITVTISQTAYDVLTTVGQNAVHLVVEILVMLYVLFFCLRDGEKILQRLMHLLPLGDANEAHLYRRFVSTVRATLKGTIVIGALQGLIGGLAFGIAGVPAATFWTIIMIACSIIPGVGASLILLPASIILLLTGQTGSAIIVFVGMIIAGTIDNVIRGPFVGKDTQLHPLLIFLSTLGGLLAFGISGFMIGPVLAALAVSLWEMYEHKYHKELIAQK